MFKHDGSALDQAREVAINVLASASVNAGTAGSGTGDEM
jgi:hypothetical protein